MRRRSVPEEFRGSFRPKMASCKPSFILPRQFQNTLLHERFGLVQKTTKGARTAKPFDINLFNPSELLASEFCSEAMMAMGVGKMRVRKLKMIICARVTDVFPTLLENPEARDLIESNVKLRNSDISIRIPQEWQLEFEGLKHVDLVGGGTFIKVFAVVETSLQIAAE